MNPVNVLIVDDSALVRQVLAHGLALDPEIHVVGTATDPYKAQELIREKHPDVLTLDVEMPRMNGLVFLKKLMQESPLPVIMVSALTERGSRVTLEALANGAVDFVLKPSVNIRQNLTAMIKELQTKIKVAAKVKLTLLARSTGGVKRPSLVSKTLTGDWSKNIIAIGASTGGTEAIRSIITALPQQMPGIVIVQHMPAGFTKQFAHRLNNESALQVKEARSGDHVLPGHVLIAPGDYHLQIVRYNGTYRVICRKGARVNGYRPSVDVLFRSVAKHAGKNAIGIILTGMGDDGADAMVAMRRAGAFTIAQDEATSVVFGMPKEAYRRGGAQRLVPLQAIPSLLLNRLHKTPIPAAR